MFRRLLTTIKEPLIVAGRPKLTTAACGMLTRHGCRDTAPFGTNAEPVLYARLRGCPSIFFAP